MRMPSARAMRRILNLWPPFLFAGIRVLEISDDWRRARVVLRRHWYNRNFVGTHFGGSLFAMTDPFWMVMTLYRMGGDYIVWDKAAEIDFVEATKAPVYAAFELDDATIDAIRAATASGEKYLRWFETEIRTAEGEVVARVRKQIYVRRKHAA
jgi:acyl-coenzyme A thioesterase PaaI-like protein